ncbi:MAG: hypothetical protein M3N68_05190 [Actinomycetota bacterium]|nr:hypothetical protein [Actinomycetota bacterium]
MPWCEDCSRFFSHDSLGAEGECPTCGLPIGTTGVEPRAPWHFKLLVLAAVLYLGYRFLQGVAWLVDHV